MTIHFDVESESWQRLLRVLPDEIMIVDHNGVIRFVRDRLAELTGYSNAELLGQPVELLVALSSRDRHVLQRLEYARESIFRQMGASHSYALLHKDGREVRVVIALSPISVDDAPWVIVAIHDDRSDPELEGGDHQEALNTAASKVASAVLLADSEEGFRFAFEGNMAPMIFTDLDDRIIAANDAFCDLIGFTKDEVMGHDSRPFTVASDVGITEEAHRQMASGEVGHVRYVKRYRHKDGRIIFVEVSKSPARDASGRTLYYVISERDVTDRVRRDRLLELLSEVNRLASGAINERLFLQELCDVLVDKGGFKLAWIGLPSRDDDGGIQIHCAAGDTDYLYGGMLSWWGTTVSGLGPTGVALRTGKSQVVGNLALDSIFAPWRDRAVRFGFGSSVAIPSVLENQIAVLNLYDANVYAFDDLTLRGLEDLVEDAKFAVAHVRSVDETRKSLERVTDANVALKSSELRFRLAFEDNMAPWSSPTSKIARLRSTTRSVRWWDSLAKSCSVTTPSTSRFLMT